MKSIISLLLLISSLFSLTINESLLKIHATLVPKISFMDYQYKEKSKDNTVSVSILYDAVNYPSAFSLKEQMKEKYKNGINSYNVAIKLIPYTALKKQKANIYYLFPSDSKNIKKALKIASSNQALTFSYLKNDLKYGVMISLNVGSQVKPILNLNAIKKNNITLRPVLLDISTIYINENESLLKNMNMKGFNKYKLYIAFLTPLKNKKTSL